MDLTVRKENFVLDSRDWVMHEHGLDVMDSITLDLAEFVEGTHYPNGFIPSGTPLSELPTGLYGPYGGTSDEVQTVTEGGSGLTSFTLTFSGQTTGSIAAAATAATVQTALEALSNIAPGDVVVTGSAGGPYTVTFGGTLADTNVAQMTATPTGGTGTVTVATQTAGGADVDADRAVLVGHLGEYVKVRTGATKLGGSLFWHGAIKEDKLPFPVDANGKADVAGSIRYRSGV
jgi:hypothetical protein